MRSTVAALVILAGCTHASPPKPLPGNTVTVGMPITVGPDEPLGWLAIGTLRATDNSWIPVSQQIGAFTLTGDPLPARVTVIGGTGGPEVLSVASSVPLKYGCDNNELGVRPLAGVRLPPGPAWILPPAAPETWRPTAHRLSRTQADPTARTHVAGALTITAVRRDANHANVAITRDGKAIFTSTYERAIMDGADLSQALDLTETTPGIPEPLAVWSISTAGPFLVVMLLPGYEGVSLQPLLVEETSARVVEGMEVYLYGCAF